ncbi:MAG: methionyl-tRNA formyltransferase [Rhodospirillales bacterium]|nr:MAG: methionyl-tRNA formyltransferase [Rhodospirillales bacterium]
MTYRIVFMGTPEFAVPALAALSEAGHEIACVYTQPPRPAGRGKRARISMVHAFAALNRIPVRHPETLRDAASQAEFASLEPDLAVVAAYGLILPEPVLAAPRHGCLNIHASLLPRWRGAAPIQRAILAGDRETGITIMRMDEGLDTGPMLLQERVPIGPDTDAGELHDTLAALGAEMIVEALDRLRAGTLTETPQPADGATYATKIDKAETRIDWTRPATELVRQVNAFSPAPGAWFEIDGERIRVLSAEARAGDGDPGTVLDERLTVACGDGALRILGLQLAGKTAMAAESFLRGHTVPRGTVLA